MIGKIENFLLISTFLKVTHISGAPTELQNCSNENIWSSLMQACLLRLEGEWALSVFWWSLCSGFVGTTPNSFSGTAAFSSSWICLCDADCAAAPVSAKNYHKVSVSKY